MYLNIKKKSSVVPIMLMTLIDPEIIIGSFSIGSLYIFEIVLFFYIVITKKVLIVSIVNRYLKSVFICLLIYIISWIMFSRMSIGSLYSCVFGAVKLSIALIECCTLNESFRLRIQTDIVKLITVTLVLNVIFLFIQMSFFNQSLWILKNVFLSSSEYEYAFGVTYAGHYVRYGGLFKYPMHLGVFCSLAIAFSLSLKTKELSKIKLLIIFLSIFCGIMSSTKSFFIGVSVVYFFYIFENSIQLLENRRKLIYRLFPLVIVILIVFYWNSITQFIGTVFGVNAMSYAMKTAEFFYDAGSIFDTRFGESGAIVTLLEVVKENILFGVGPASIRGESVMDNAVLVIAHNGGIIALLVIIIYYIKTAIILYKQKLSILLIVAILASGMGFQTWFASYLTIWACYYFDVEVYNIKNKKVLEYEKR